MIQQGDVLLFQTLDNGEINVENGIVEMSGGLEGMAYIALFGGNIDDDGRQNLNLGWWGNNIEKVEARKIVSRTQNLMQTIPLTSGNLELIRKTVLLDLNVFLMERIVSEITVEVTIPRLNWVHMAITMNAFGLQSQFEFTENWLATQETSTINTIDIVPAPEIYTLVDGDGNKLVADADTLISTGA